MSDVPGTLEFVNPAETDGTYRAVLWAAPGQGKSVAAASAPDPILVLSADRPSAYRFARKHHQGKDIREVRFIDESTLVAVYRYLRENTDVRTLVVDPFGNVYAHLIERAPTRGDGEPDYQLVNKKLLGFVTSLRAFDINVILVAHEKLNDGKRGDNRLYPDLGGPALTNKLLAEMDIVARVERHVSSSDEGEEEVRWVGQLQPRGNLVCKESTGALGDRRIADLSRWFEVANESLAVEVADLPWEDGGDAPEAPPAPSEPEGDPEPAQAFNPVTGRFDEARERLQAEVPEEVSGEVVAELVDERFASDIFEELKRRQVTVGQFRALLAGVGADVPPDLRSAEARLAALGGLSVVQGVDLSKLVGSLPEAAAA